MTRKADGSERTADVGLDERVVAENDVATHRPRPHEPERRGEPQNLIRDNPTARAENSADRPESRVAPRTAA